MAKLQEKIDTKTEEMENLKKECKESKKNKDSYLEKKKTKLTKIMVNIGHLSKFTLFHIQTTSFFKETLCRLETLKTDRDENKQIALGTSKLNYLDPRYCLIYQMWFLTL